MPNTFISLNVPSGQGAGIAAIVGNTGHPKSFVLAGAPAGSRYVVEGSNDGGANWDILIDDDGTQTLFTNNNGGTKSVDCIVEQVRVRNIRPVPNAVTPSITMGAPPALGPNFFGRLAVPETQGLGEPLDLGLRVGPLKTFIVRGAVAAGGRFTILGSMDGEQFDEVIQFTADQQGARSLEVMCRYLRVLRGGALGPAPTISVGGEAVQEAAGGTGTASSELSIASDRGYEATSNTDEEVLAEYAAPLAALDAATLALDFTTIIRADNERAAFRVRIGGTPGAPDGEQLVSLASTGPEAPRSIRSAAFARPTTGTTLVKVTGQGSGVRMRGFHLLFHSVS